MAKRIQLLLTEDVRKLGRSGDLVEVAPGYARNYLIPRGIGERVTPSILRQVERRRALEEKRLQEERQAAESIKTALETIGRFTITKQAGENEAIFGTVTNQDVADAIQATASKEIDRKNITVPDINKLGFYSAEVKLHPSVVATVNIQVVPGSSAE